NQLRKKRTELLRRAERVVEERIEVGRHSMGSECAEEQVFLSVEVGVDGARRDTCRLGDLVDGRRAEPLGGEQTGCGRDEFTADALAPGRSTHARWWCRRPSHRFG